MTTFNEALGIRGSKVIWKYFFLLLLSITAFHIIGFILESIISFGKYSLRHDDRYLFVLGILSYFILLACPIFLYSPTTKRSFHLIAATSALVSAFPGLLFELVQNDLHIGVMLKCVFANFILLESFYYALPKSDTRIGGLVAGFIISCILSKGVIMLIRLINGWEYHYWHEIRNIVFEIILFRFILWLTSIMLNLDKGNNKEEIV